MRTPYDPRLLLQGASAVRFKHGLVIANEHARQTREQLPVALELLAAAGMDLTKIRLDHHHIRQIVAEHRAQSDIVIVAGGDGTINATVDAIVESGLPLAVLPMGTANDLARTLGIPFDIKGACELVAAGHTKRIDLGWVNGKYYFNVASLGLSVAITQRLTGDIKRWLGALAYCATAMKVLWRYRPFHAEIHVGGEVLHVKTVQIAVGNGCFYGGGMQIASDAAIDDQLLDLYSIEIDHWSELFPLLRALRTGRLAEQQRIRTLKAQEVRIVTRRSKRINTDGEITSSTPALFKVVPQALDVCVPSPAAP